MRKSRLPPDRIEGKLAAVARNIASGSTVAAACGAAGITVPSYYRWRSRWRGRGREDSSAAMASTAMSSVSDRIRDALLEAGKALFLREGFSVSIDKVAAAAGVGRQTLYNRFGSKARLFAEVVQSLYQRNVAPALVVERGSDLATMLADCGRHLLKLMLDPEAVALLRITLGEYRDRPRLATLAYAIRSSRVVPNVAGVIARRLRAEMDAGRMDAADPVLAAEAFCGSITAYARHRALVGLKPPSPEELEQTLQLSIRIFTRGLGWRP